MKKQLIPKNSQNTTIRIMKNSNISNIASCMCACVLFVTLFVCQKSCNPSMNTCTDSSWQRDTTWMYAGDPTELMERQSDSIETKNFSEHGK